MENDGLLLLAHFSYVVYCLPVFIEGVGAGFCDLVAGVGESAIEGFNYFQVACGFEFFYMAGEVASC